MRPGALLAVDEATPTRRRVTVRRPDVFALAGLVASFFAVHDVGRWLSAPYWLDEAWVAVSTRVAIADLPTVTASTPLGWTLALRAVPDPNLLRLVPMGFHLVALIAAYGLGRRLWSTTAAGTLAGVAAASAVLLLPAQQLRHDLKQYSADAAICLLLLVLAAAPERDWSRRRLALTALAVPIGMLFSHTTAIVAAALFGALIVVPAARRQWRHCLESVAASLVAAVGAAIVYLGVSRRGRTDQLDAYWSGYFPSPGEVPGYVVHRIRELAPILGLPALLWVVMVLAGLVVIGRAGRPVLLVTLALIPMEMVGLGVARIYPLLDPRVAHFALVASAAVAAIGLAGIGLACVSALAARRPPFALAAAVVAVGLIGYATANLSWYRFDGTVAPRGVDYVNGTEDVRAQVEYVRAHLGPHDVVVMNSSAVYGVAFYWNSAQIHSLPYVNAIGFSVAPPVGNMIVANDGTSAGVDAAVRAGLDRAKAADGALWIILTHARSEFAFWQDALAGYTVEEIGVGPEPVHLIERP